MIATTQVPHFVRDDDPALRRSLHPAACISFATPTNSPAPIPSIGSASNRTISGYIARYVLLTPSKRSSTRLGSSSLTGHMFLNGTTHFSSSRAQG